MKRTQHASSPRPPWTAPGGRRIARIAAKVSVGLIAALAAGGGLTLTLLHTQSARDLACRQLVAAANRSLQGTLTVGRCVALTPWRVELREVTLALGEARPAAAQRVVVEPALWPLLQGHLRLRNLHLDAPVLSLAAGPTGELVLLTAVSPQDAAPAPAPDARNQSQGAVETLSVRRLQVTGLPRGLVLEGVDIDAGVRWGESTSLAITRAAGRLRDAEGTLAERVAVSGQLHSAPDARSQLVAAITAGTSRLKATLDARLRAPQGPRYVARARASLTQDALQRLGVAAQLKGAVQAQLGVRGAGLDATLRGALRTAGGDLYLNGQLQPKTASLSLRSDALSLRHVVTEWPALVVKGGLHVELDRWAEGRPTFRMDTIGLSAADIPLGALRAEGQLNPTELTLDELRVTELLGTSGTLHASGRFDFVGEGRLGLRVRIPEIARAPWAQGRAGELAGRARLTMDATVRRDALRLRGDLDVRGARWARSSLGRLHVEAQLAGTPTRPSGSLSARLRSLALGGLEVRLARALVRGGPTHYRASARLELAAGERVSAALDGRRLDDGLALDGDVQAHGLPWRGPMNVRVRGATLRAGQRILIPKLRATAPGLAAHGSFERGRAGQLTGRLTIERADLRALRVNPQGLGGVIQGSARVGGTQTRPRLSGRLRWSRPALRGRVARHATSQFALDIPGRRWSGSLALDGDALGSLTARAAGRLQRSPGPWLRALLDGTVQGRAHLQVPHLGRVAPPYVPPLTGGAEATLDVVGALRRPTATLRANARDLRVGGDTRPVTAAAHLTLEEGTARLDAQVSIPGQEPLRARAVAKGLNDLSRPPAWRSLLLRETTEAHVSIPSVELGALPAGPALLADTRASLTLDGQGGPAGPSARLRAHMVYLGSSRDGVVGACADASIIEGELSVDVQEGISGARLQLSRGDARILRGNLAVPTPVRRWLQEGTLSVGTLAASLHLDDLKLDALPYACRTLRGDLTGEASLTVPWTHAPTLSVHLRARALRAREGPPADLSAELQVGAQALDGRLVLTTERTPRVVASVRAPVRWHDAITPAIDAARTLASVRLRRAPLAVLTSPVPAFASARGAVTGTLRVEPDGATGEAILENVSLVVRDPFVRLERVSGHLLLAPGRFEVTNLVAHDLDGRVQMSGQVRLGPQWQPERATFDIRTQGLPVRREGVLLATVDADTRLDADLQGATRQATLGIRRLAVGLPDDGPRSVQPLTPHPDVRYDGAEGPRRPPLPAATDSAQPRPPWVVRVDGRAPFWVRHGSFAFQLAADLRVTVDERGTRVAGPVEVRRGYLELAGRTFHVRGGRLTFDGGGEVDPQVAIDAVHTLPSRHTVTVRVRGRTRAPSLSFSTSVPGITTEAEILALLASGRRDRTSASAADQAARALGGLVAGLLGTLTRRELGAHIPVLAIESGGASAARLRAGLQLDELVPESWRRVVRGVYVEGYVGTREQSARATGGALVELYHPRDLVTSGTYEEPSSWSLDLLWEP